MDVSTKIACFDEITHQICDSDLKVTINHISSNWKINFRQSEALLLDWCSEHSETAVKKEYLIRGVDPQGHCVISVVPESRLENAKILFPQFCSSLYSVELPSGNARIGGHKLSSDVVINLPLDAKERAARSSVASVDVKTLPKPVVKPVLKQEVKPEPKVKPSPFKTTKAQDTKSPPKDAQEKLIKVEPATPKHSPPKKNAATKTPVTAKSSIASFFSKPSATQKPPTKVEKVEPMEVQHDSAAAMPEKKEATPVKQDVVKKEIPFKKASDTIVDKSRKRSIADAQDSDESEDTNEKDAIPATPEQSSSNTKRARKATTNNAKNTSSVAKRTKLSKPIDSSDEDDIPSTPQVATKRANKTVVEAKTVSRLRRIVDSDSEDDTPPAKQEPPTGSGPRRAKAKRTVTRMYEDANGYMKSVKEIEEYTCSEDESDVVAQPDPKESSENQPPIQQKSHAKTPTKTVKKKTPPKATAGNKQGSILSFFSKK